MPFDLSAHVPGWSSARKAHGTAVGPTPAQWALRTLFHSTTTGLNDLGT